MAPVARTLQRALLLSGLLTLLTSCDSARDKADGKTSVVPVAPATTASPAAPVTTAPSAPTTTVSTPADRYDPAKMDFKPPSAILSGERHTGAFAQGNSLSL